MEAHIYLVTNSINGKQYVGQTINKENKLGHGRILKSAYKLHGKDNFTYEKIATEIDNRNTLNYLERFWIKVFNSIVPNGYNIDIGGSEGNEWTDERRRKHSLSRKGKKIKRPLGSKSGMKGKKYPEEGKRKLSEALKGNKFALGFKHTVETKEKMSESQKRRYQFQGFHNWTGKKHTEEWKRQASIRMSQQVQSEETKKKRSESIKLWHAKRKQGQV